MAASAAAAAAVVAAVTDEDTEGMGLALAQVSGSGCCAVRTHRVPRTLSAGEEYRRRAPAHARPPLTCPTHHSLRRHSHGTRQGELALASGEVPIGCVFVHPHTRAVLAAGQNRTNVDFNVRGGCVGAAPLLWGGR